MLVVQLVEILWTKESRGAPQATVRARLPRAFAVPGASAPYTIQHIRIAEWEGFSPSHVKTEQKASVPGVEGSLRIELLSDRVTLGLGGDPSGGKPVRHPAPQAVTLRSNEFGRLVTNARHTSYCGQYYSEHVFNVAFGDDVASDVFVRSAPDHEFSQSAHLF